MNKSVLFMLLFFFVGGSFLGTLSSVSASRLVEDTWNMKTPMEQARTHLGVVAVDDKIYAIGGYADYSHFLNTTERYDPKADKWVTLTSMPTPRHSFGIVAWQDKIYCIGGIIYEDGQWFTCNTNEVYDTATNEWSTKASTPFQGSIGRYRWSTIQIHVVDGNFFAINNGNLFLYDPIADSWTKKANAPYTVCDASAVVDNKIIVYRIFGFTAVEAKPMVYNTKTDNWNELKKQQPFTASLFGHAVTGVTTGLYAPQNIYVFIEKNIYVHEPINGTWTTAKATSTDYSGYGVAVVDDILYVIGGSINGQYVPIGYRSTAYTTPTQSNSNPPEQSNPTRGFIICIIVAVVALTVGIVAGLFFYFNKKKAGMRYTSPIQQQYKGYVKYN